MRKNYKVNKTTIAELYSLDKADGLELTVYSKRTRSKSPPRMHREESNRKLMRKKHTRDKKMEMQVKHYS